METAVRVKVSADRRRSVLPVLTLLATAAACAHREPAAPAVLPASAPTAPAEEEWDRELPAAWQLHDFAGDESEDFGLPAISVIAVRVVDDVTDAPIAGARIDNWWEADTPHAEPWDQWHEGAWTTDLDGLAVVPAVDRAPWYYVEAPGYAPFGEMALEDEYRLVRGVDAVVEVRDVRGVPVAGVVVDYLLGCGHTANVRCETTGADGRVVLRCVDPRRGDVWLRAPGLAGRNEGYGGLPLPVDGVHVVHGNPSPVLEGRVLRADGTPAAGARVGSREAHRGPWTVAGADGRYRLVGAIPGDELMAMAPHAEEVPEGFEPLQTEFRSVPGVFATVRLPAEPRRRPTNEERQAERDRRRAEREAFERGDEPDPVLPPDGPGIRVRVSAAPGATPSRRVGLLFVRDGDGRALRCFPRFRDGVAERAEAVGLGTWTVIAGDVSGALRPSSQRVVVTSGWSVASFTLAANPVWRVRVAEQGADGVVRERGLVEGDRVSIVGETDHGVATLRLDARGDADGRIHVPATGRFVVELRSEGRVARAAFDGPPDDAGPVLALPALPPDEDVRDVAERPRELAAARVQVFLPDGRPAAGRRVTVVTKAEPLARDREIPRSDTWELALDDDGAATSGFDRGDRVVLEADDDAFEGTLPLVATIGGPGPWTLRWPAGEVTLRAVDASGAPLDEFAVAQIGWDAWDPTDGAVRLRGVAPGPLRLLVGAPGCRMRDVRLVLAPDEKRDVAVTLRPRAAADR